MSDPSDLRDLVRRSLEAFNNLTPEEQRAHRREQRISWVHGEHCLKYDPPTLTREDVARIVDGYDEERR